MLPQFVCSWLSLYHLRFHDLEVEKSYQIYSWELNSPIYKAFTIGNVLHSIYVLTLVNLTPGVVFTPYSIATITIIVIICPLILCALSFLHPYRHFLPNLFWNFLLCLTAVSMAMISAVRNLLCYYHKEVQRACPLDGRPNASNLFIYSTLGPILAIIIFRVNRLAATGFFFLLMGTLVWNVAILPGNNISIWFLLIFFIGSFSFALLLNWLRERNERAVYTLRRDLEREVDQRTVAENQLREEVVSRAQIQVNLEAEIEERKRAQKEAKRAEDDRIKFTNYIFHEVRGPLSGVVLSENLLQSDDSIALISDEAKASLAHIRGGLASVQTILNDVLDFSKFSQGHFPLNSKPFDLHETVKTTIWRMEATWKDKGIQFATDLDPRIDLIAYYLLADPDRINQVISNYLSNAVKFTNTGGRIRLKTELVEHVPKTATVRLSVTDTGIGISEENQKSLFRDFVQINSEENTQVSKGVKGTGLGLAICASIVKSFGGTYGVTSEVGQGSTFWFQIPFEITTERKRDVLDNLGVPKSEVSLKLLVADDDATVRLVLKRTLTKMGHNVVLAKDGLEALTAIQTDHTLDVVLIDNSMPILEGKEVIQKVRASGNDIPIISLSGTTEREFSEKLISLGANQVLPKPTTAEMLDRALRAVRLEQKDKGTDGQHTSSDSHKDITYL